MLEVLALVFATAVAWLLRIRIGGKALLCGQQRIRQDVQLAG